MKAKPLHDRLIVRVLEAESSSSGGILIPDNAKEKPNRGEVIAVGSGRTLENGSTQAMTVTVGDHVMFGKFAGHTLKVDGQELTVLKEEDVFAIIEQ